MFVHFNKILGSQLTTEISSNNRNLRKCVESPLVNFDYMRNYISEDPIDLGKPVKTQAVSVRKDNTAGIRFTNGFY